MYSDEMMDTIHQTSVDTKLHEWNEHGERNMLPRAAMVFRDFGLLNLHLEQGVRFYHSVLEKLPAHARSVLET